MSKQDNYGVLIAASHTVTSHFWLPMPEPSGEDRKDWLKQIDTKLRPNEGDLDPFAHGTFIGSTSSLEQDVEVKCGKTILRRDVIASIEELSMAYFGLGKDELGRMSKALYKGTACGAWLQVLVGLYPKGAQWVDPVGVDFESVSTFVTAVRIGTIVEGSDACVDGGEWEFPFLLDSFSSAIEEMEQEADRLWKEANGEDEDDGA